MPRYGFNFQWMFMDQGNPPQEPDERALDFMAANGFDFVRIPCDYNFWTTDFNYFEPDEVVFKLLDRYLAACQARGFHLSLNLHRAPGYCINRNDLEKHNLWLDAIAQDAFVFLWETFARRYQSVSSRDLSFDLLNEPPSVGDFGLTRDNHAALIRRTAAAIRAIDPSREIVIDGLAGGNVAMPELADLGVVHSGRGYQPMPVSHWGATWWTGWQKAAGPIYPGGEWDGKIWDKAALHEYYAPWRAVADSGVTVHIGEFGCFNQTPNDAALRWFADLLDLYQQYGWGYALWNFEGAFGIVEHGRPGARYAEMNGYKVDQDLLALLQQYRIPG
ncbi:MAG: glycoside hydrolase family 5 protein [Anaerolineae bacterium]|nr:glycoside hydrolase family 5 protein [Anaerolineae bacterium]